MKLSKKTRTRLDLIRLEGLRKLLSDKYDDETLINKISNVTGTTPKDKKAIENVPRYQLIQIIESSTITEEEINNCYEEYRYGQKPGFVIFSFKSSKQLSTETVETKIKDELSKYPIDEDEQPSIKSVKYNNAEEFKEESLIEFSFYYSKKYSYINENEEPNYIYELKETFAWLSKEYNFIAIKNCDERVIKRLAKILSAIYEAELYPIVLTKELVKRIFGDKQKKVAGINLNATEKEAEKMMVFDSKLNEKPELQKQLEPYTPTSQTLEIIVDDVINNLGVNNSKGKLHLTKNTNASTFRAWSVTTIKKVIEYIANNETELEIFKGRNIVSNPIFENYTSENKKLIEEIIFKIFTFLEDKNYSPVITHKINYSKISKYFYNKIFVSCEKCNDTHSIPQCSKCNSYNLKLMSIGNINCVECGEILNTVLCENGDSINVDNIENLNIYLYPSEELFGDIIKCLHDVLNIDFKGYFSIVNNNIQITEKSSGALLKIDDIQELSEISKRTITTTEKETLIATLKKMGEKCKNTSKDACNSCDSVSTSICIMKLFTTYEGYRPRPHQGHEFGDVNFKVTLNNSEQEFVGIAKSYCNLTRSSSPAREMKDQIIIATQDKRINIIGAICPARFDPQLEKDIEYLAKCTGSKIVILDDNFMVKQLNHYNDKIEKSKNN